MKQVTFPRWVFTRSGRAGSAERRDLIATAAFRGVQGVAFPFAVAGYALWLARLLRFSRRSKVSATALASLYSRWMLHELGTRRDEAAARLMRVLPNVPRPALRLVTGPTLLGHRLTGHIPQVYRYPYEGEPNVVHHAAARTTFFDAVLEHHLGGIEQFVVLGAGFDTRAYRLPVGAGIRCFEIDTPRTQRHKREMLEQAGVNEPLRVTYVPADFMTDDWLDKLRAVGFDREKRAFFLWESVSMYLDREAVEKTLRKIAATAVGSIVAFDYLCTEFIEAPTLAMRYARTVLRFIGEPWTFGIDGPPPMEERLAEFLRAQGLALLEHHTIWQGPDRKQPAGGLLTARV